MRRKKARFQVSDKVVCIYAFREHPEWFTDLPAEGRVYVVREVSVYDPYTTWDGKEEEGGEFIKLVGIFTVQPADDPRRHHHLFNAGGFRKLEDVRAASERKARRRRKNKAIGFRVSDKVVLIEQVQSVDCFKPVPEVGRVYVVREVAEASDGHGLRLVGIQGVHEEGQEVHLNALKFRKLEEVRSQGMRRRRKKGDQ
jgi:hypothetical protein